MLAAAAPAETAAQPELHFAGELSVPWALGLGVALAALSWWLYRRDLRGRAGWMLWVLPLLRALVILALLGILTGPVLVTRTAVGTTPPLPLTGQRPGRVPPQQAGCSVGRRPRTSCRPRGRAPCPPGFRDYTTKR